MKDETTELEKIANELTTLATYITNRIDLGDPPKYHPNQNRTTKTPHYTGGLTQMSKLNILQWNETVELNNEGISDVEAMKALARLDKKELRPNNSNIFRMAGFTPGKEYKTIGLSHKIFSDGEAVKVIILTNDEGTVVEKVMSNFKIKKED